MSTEKAIASITPASSNPRCRDTSSTAGNSAIHRDSPQGRAPSAVDQSFSSPPQSGPTVAPSSEMSAVDSHKAPFGQYAPGAIKTRQAPPGANPAVEIVTGYTKIIFTAGKTRVSVAPAHRRHRTSLIVAALMIRSDLEAQHGKIEHRLEGEPKIRVDGTIKLTLLSRRYRPRHTVVVTPEQLAAHLREWTTR